MTIPKIYKKQKIKNGMEFIYLPTNNPIGDYAEWIRVPEGMLLKNKRMI